MSGSSLPRDWSSLTSGGGEKSFVSYWLFVKGAFFFSVCAFDSGKNGDLGKKFGIDLFYDVETLLMAFVLQKA